MILIVASNTDIASLNIRRQILKYHFFCVMEKTFQSNPLYAKQVSGQEVILATLSDEAVNAQNLPDDFPNTDLIVFISRHSSKSGRPTLSVHTTGNFGDSELGGRPRKVSIAPASAMHTALKALNVKKEEMKLNYEVSYECTHHGPSIDVPTMFIELGSSQPQWGDLQAARAVGDATMATILKFSVSTKSAILGIGGTHYNQKFTRMALEDKAIFGHMIPKYAVHLLDVEMLTQCIDCTLERVSAAVLDWKGIRSEDKQNLISALQEVELPFKKV
jgi:D-aminoacyl-tRNA deacylase